MTAKTFHCVFKITLSDWTRIVARTGGDDKTIPAVANPHTFSGQRPCRSSANAPTSAFSRVLLPIPTMPVRKQFLPASAGFASASMAFISLRKAYTKPCGDLPENARKTSQGQCPLFVGLVR